MSAAGPGRLQDHPYLRREDAPRSSAPPALALLRAGLPWRGPPARRTRPGHRDPAGHKPRRRGPGRPQAPSPRTRPTTSPATADPANHRPRRRGLGRPQARSPGPGPVTAGPARHRPGHLGPGRPQPADRASGRDRCELGTAAGLLRLALAVPTSHSSTHRGAGGVGGARGANTPPQPVTRRAALAPAVGTGPVVRGRHGPPGAPRRSRPARMMRPRRVRTLRRRRPARIVLPAAGAGPVARCGRVGRPESCSPRRGRAG
jgi:hypothetical protein